MLGRHLFIDADDTLWENQSHHDAAEQAFVRLAVSRGVPEPEVIAALRGVHGDVIAREGVGPHTHVMSVREAFRALFGPLDVEAAALIDGCFRGVFCGERVLLPGVVELLPRLAERHHTVLLTRGVKGHQLDKFERSGLEACFRDVHVVPDKTPELFTELLCALGGRAQDASMIGNSLKSDIRPALEAGLWGVHIPSALQAHFDRDPDGCEHERLCQLGSFAELARLLDD